MSYRPPPNDPKTHPQIALSKGPTVRKDFRTTVCGPGTAIVRDRRGDAVVVELVQPQPHHTDDSDPPEAA
jgi:hypothetical protein